MKIGIIGSGRVGYSMGKYMQDHGIGVTGFMTGTGSAHLMRHNLQVRTGFDGIEDLVAASDTLFSYHF